MNFQSSYRLLRSAAKNIEVKKKDGGEKKQVTAGSASEKRKQDTTEKNKSEKRVKIVSEEDDDVIILEDTRTNGIKSGSTESKSLASVAEASSVVSVALEKPESSALTGELVDLSTPPKKSEGSVLTGDPHVVDCAQSDESPVRSKSTAKSSALTGDLVDLSTPKESKGSVSTADPHIANCAQSDEPPVCSKSTAEPYINDGTQSSHREGSTSIVELDTECIQKKDLLDSSGNGIQSNHQESSLSVVEFDTECIKKKDLCDSSGNGTQSSDREGSALIVKLDSEHIQKKDLHDSSGDGIQPSDRESSASIVERNTECTQKEDLHGPSGNDIQSNDREGSASIVELETKHIQKKDLHDSSGDGVQSSDRKGSASIVERDTEYIQNKDEHDSSGNDPQPSDQEDSVSIVERNTECIQKKDLHGPSGNGLLPSDLEDSVLIIERNTECIQKEDLHGPSGDDIQSSDREGSASVVELDTKCIQKKDLNNSSGNAELCLEKSISSVVSTDSETNNEPNIEEEEDSEVPVCNVEKQHTDDDDGDDATTDEEIITNKRSCDRKESVGGEKSENDDFEFVEECHFTDPSAPDRSKSDYYCDLCDAHMNNLTMWESHVNGKRHAKNLKKEPGERSSQIKSVLKEDAVPLIQDDLDNISEPVVGLSFICEYERLSCNPMYSCFLCGGSMVKTQVLEHVKSTKHRLNFFKEVEPEAALLFENVQMKKDAKENLLWNKAVEWEAEHGREKMEVRVENRKCDLSPRSATTNGNRSSREDRTASRKNRSRSSLRRKSPGLRRDRYSPGSRRDGFSPELDNPEYESRRDRYSQGSRRDRYSPDFLRRASPGFQRRTSPDFRKLRDSPDRTSPSSRRAYRERSPYLDRRDESCSSRYGLESSMHRMAEGRTERDGIIDAILNLKRDDDVETKICLLERLSVMPIETEQEAQVAMHVIKILQDCVIYYKLRRLPKELQAVVAHKLIRESQERPTMSSMPLNIPSAAVSSGSLLNMGNRLHSTGIYPPSLSNHFSNSATFNSVLACSRSPMGSYAVARAPEVPYHNVYNGLGSSTATVVPGTFQNFSDYSMSDLRSILNNIRNMETPERRSSVSIPSMNSLNAYNSDALPRQRPSTSSSFRNLPYPYRRQ